MTGDDIATTAEAAEGAVLRLGRAVHTDPKSGPTPEQETLPAAVQQKPVDRKSAAEWAYERLILYIQGFEKTLDDEHEVAMGLTDTGAGILRIEGLGYFDPDIITFYGKDSSEARVQLVQHVSQLNVVLRAARKPDPEEAPRRIGFELAKAFENDL